jgi:protein transport protein SEC24
MNKITIPPSLVISLDSLPHFTGGSLFFYPGFSAVRPEDAFKFSSEFSRHLAHAFGLEAVLRVRASKGIRLSAFHGNFFVRSTDLLSLPNVNPDNAYAIQIAIDENLTSPLACFQTALLYTTSYGERRIRVLTTALPVSSDIAAIFRAVNAPTMVNLLSKMAVERALTAKIEDARDALVNKVIEVIGVYRR